MRRTDDTTGQTVSTDILSDPTVCQRDVSSFQDLGVNTVVVRDLDSKQDHGPCLQVLEDNGIYVIVSLPTVAYQVTSVTSAWTLEMFQDFTDIVDELSSHLNVLAYYAATESIDTPVFGGGQYRGLQGPYTKAIIRDIRAYMQQRNYRSVPMGYSNADNVDVQLSATEYLTCGSNTSKSQ